MRITVLVTYASRHGSTQAIAERIAKTLCEQGLAVEVERAGSVSDASAYDAFVVGGAVYFGSWLKEATQFVQQNSATLANRPTWIFSSGPIGTATTDAQGRDLLIASEPKEFAEIREVIKPRGLRVFFGALDPSKLGLSERLLRTLPAARAVLPEGDFRDWKDIEAWATGIAVHLATLNPAPAGLSLDRCTWGGQ